MKMSPEHKQAVRLVARIAALHVRTYRQIPNDHWRTVSRTAVGIAKTLAQSHTACGILADCEKCRQPVPWQVALS